jgi:hypothetical protein
VRAPQRAQRQALAERRHVAALDRRRDIEAERQFRRIIGYRDLAKLSIAIERDLERHRQPTFDHTATKEAAIVATA